MKIKFNLKILIPIIVVIIIIVITIIYPRYSSNVDHGGFSDASQVPTEPKKYDINEYNNLYISDQDMCIKYLNNYFSILSRNIDAAYNLLDEEYKNKKFGNVQNFILYVNQKYSTFSDISKFYVRGNIYYVYDKSNNLFIFSTKGVMSYKVYFDDDTVDITEYK